MLMNTDRGGRRIHEILAECKPDPTTGESDIAPLVALLEANGWSTSQLHMNELPVERERDLEMQGRFISTAHAIATKLERAGISDFLFIKCRRAYDLYWDTNVDVVVGRENYHEVIDALTAETWLMPSRASQVDQFIIERGKLKLMPENRQELMAAHVYRALSWRYQESFLPMDAVEREPWHGLAVPATQDDILLLVAHSVFENYRLTLGEVIHFALLKHHRQELIDLALEQAAQLGMTAGVREVFATAERVIAGPTLYEPTAFPVQFDTSTMTAIMRERVACRTAGISSVGLGAEAASVAATYGGLRVIRELRRRRRGSHGFRKDTKTRWV